MTTRSGTLLLLPGAGSGRDQPTLVRVDAAVTALAGWSTVRADFPYRKAGRRAPDKPEVLMAAVRHELAAIGGRRNVVVGGRSMGGRICSMVAAGADGVAPPKRLLGVVTVSYPLHPPGRPERLRVEHLPDVADTAVDGDNRRPGDPPLARRRSRPQEQGRPGRRRGRRLGARPLALFGVLLAGSGPI